MTEVVILGGGPAGLGVAFYAHRAGLPFTLLEASAELGGMCRTLSCGEHLYDSGAHRFHDRDPEITRDLLALMGDDLVRVDAPSAIRDRGRSIDFPPTPLNVMFAYGFREAGRIGRDLLRSGLRRRQDGRRASRTSRSAASARRSRGGFCSTTRRSCGDFRPTSCRRTSRPAGSRA